MPQLDVLTFDNLIAGDVKLVTEPIVIGASQSIKRGDLIEKLVTEAIAVAGEVGSVTQTVAENYVRPTAKANDKSFYAVAAEDVTTGEGETAEIIGYRIGAFNENAMRFGGASTADDNHEVLADKGIYLTKAQKQ